ncbi:MAG: serine--tRNA ligase [Candidatus Omnitrophota bacterium]|nr:MAG: serine--tRNA ligase [Candidatus Omnitrophota bacterium]
MLDIKFIRDNVELVRESLKKRNSDFDFEGFLALDEKRRRFIKEIDLLREEQNKTNSQVSALLKAKKNPKEKIEEVKAVSRKVSEIEAEFRKVKDEFGNQLLNIPNVPHSSVPVEANKVVRSQGKLRKFKFKPVNHIDIAQHLDIIDFKRSSKVAGSNFSLFKGAGARINRALINFMLDLHTKKHGYTEVFPPFLVNRASMTTTGQLPKFEEDMYKLKHDDYFLIPTAEVPVTNVYRDEVLDEKQLPVCFASYTACFRRESGSYGKDTRGLVRVHQFDKVELVKFVKPQDSYKELDKLLADACKVIELLEIPYRVAVLSTQEMSFAAAKCYDIEIYAPGIDKWLEVASCSNFGDFQARRGNIRYKDKKTGKNAFLHTLNGSGVALARLIVSIIENYQEKDGSITIPKVLRGYLDGKRRITK